MNLCILKRAAIALLTLVAVVGVPGAAYSQNMNFSYYTDVAVSSDQTTLYTMVSGSDNSSGCSHWDYQSTGYVSGPTGSFQQGGSGLSTYVDVPIGAGNFYVSSSAIVSCSCFGAGLGAGGGSGLYGVQGWTTRFERDTPTCVPDGENPFIEWCIYRKVDCNHVCSGPSNYTWWNTGAYVVRTGFRVKGWCTPGFDESHASYPEGACFLVP